MTTDLRKLAEAATPEAIAKRLRDRALRMEGDPDGVVGNATWLANTAADTIDALTAQLKARHAAACNLTQKVDRAAIVIALQKWIDEIVAPPETRISFVSSSEEMLKVGRSAWDARAARSARDAWAARDARAARSAWDARAAWDARIVWDARAARDARAAWSAWSAWAARSARDAWAARAARSAWDARSAWAAWAASFQLDWLSIATIGAVSLGDDKTAKIWLPILEAFEAGAYAVWVTDAEVFVSVIPSVVAVDEQRRLHNETGPAFIWLDDISDWYWRGTNVPEHWIPNRNTLDPAEVLKSQNVEQRAAGMAIIGWKRAETALQRKIIDGDPDSDMGALVELTLPGLSEPGRFLRAVCPRNGVIVEGVPRISEVDGLPIETALAAQAWRIGDPQAEYIHPPKRT